MQIAEQRLWLRLQSYCMLAFARPRELMRRAWDRIRVFAGLVTRGRLFRWHGYLLDTRDPVLSRAVGMTTLEERAFLSWWTRERYQGRGAMVELGPFIGASTVALCRGLQANRHAAKGAGRVRVYDRFVCDQFMADSISAALHSPSLQGAYDFPPAEGSSSLPAFLRQTADYEGVIDLHPGDLLDYRHDGAPVELLFVDAMKTPELAEYIVRQFFGCLLPRHSILIQQDFVHYWTSWIHLIQYDLRDYCEFVHHIPRSASVVFTVRSAMDCARVYRLNVGSRSDAEIDEIFGYSLSLIESDLAENVHAAKAMHYYHAGKSDQCQDIVRRYLRDHPNAAHDMLAVDELLRTTAPGSDR